MKLYRTNNGCLVEDDGSCHAIDGIVWDELITRDDLERYLKDSVSGRSTVSFDPLVDSGTLRAPIGCQEVWAAGVTYFRSRDARMEEARAAGGSDFYDRVYRAERPELFFKATASRVVGHNEQVAIRTDAHWSVPEPELALLVSPTGKILGYTIGNDMSSRDIEAENPLYLPQAKIYARSCALGPGILVTSDPLPSTTAIRLEILRSGRSALAGTVTLASLKREPASLVRYLYRNNVFPNGCFLLTGTGIVPPDSFTLNQGDEIRITIEGIGTLVNSVG
jgi:2-dehydro-3-deoxy-D-arabinonate dehydratase